MRIRLDDEQGRSVDEAELHRLRVALDQLRQDEKVAVRFLQEAIKKMQSLDGVSGIISRVLGSREQQLAEAEAEVKRAQQVLQRTRAKRDQAKQALDEAKQRAASQADARVEETMTLELLADGMRDSRHPGAAVLGDLERQLEGARSELAREEELVLSGGAVMTSLSGLVNLLERTESYVAGEMMGALGRGFGLTGAMSIRDINARLARFGDQARRFREAASAAGVDLRVGGEDVGALPWALTFSTDATGPELYIIRKLIGHRRRLEYARDDLGMMLKPHQDHLEALRTTVEDLEARREAHLRSFS